MPKADHDSTTTPAPRPSRRGLLAGSTAALLAGAAFVTAARAAPVAAAMATGGDAELLAVCQDFPAETAIIDAWNAGEVTEQVGEAADDRWWDCIRTMDGIVAETDAGVAIKARCALQALEMVSDSERDAHDLARSVLAEVAAGRAGA